MSRINKLKKKTEREENNERIMKECLTQMEIITRRDKDHILEYLKEHRDFLIRDIIYQYAKSEMDYYIKNDLIAEYSLNKLSKEQIRNILKAYST